MVVLAPDTSFETALTRLKKIVYKNRVRVKEFLTDFDKLRSGFVYPNHFLTALSMAGLDKVLTPQELQIIADTYTVPRSPSLIMTDYKTFINDVEIVFTLPVSRLWRRVRTGEGVECCSLTSRARAKLPTGLEGGAKSMLSMHTWTCGPAYAGQMRSGPRRASEHVEDPPPPGPQS